MQIVIEICQNRTVREDRFFRNFFHHSNRKVLNKQKLHNNLGHTLKNWQLKIPFWSRTRIFFVTSQNLYQGSNFPKSYLPPIRGYSWHKNEIKMIRRDHVITSKTQQKRKSTENKTWVIFQECFSLTPFS